MNLRPKYALDNSKKINLPASREFTDREEPTKSFIRTFQTKEKSTIKVLTYYGIGGIGKTRLLNELYQKVDDLNSNSIKAVIDFKNEKHRNPGEALIWLREQLKKQCNIKFPTFDLAYTIYWKKLNPHLKMNAKEDLPFIEEGSIIWEFIFQLENVPFAQWVPKMVKLYSSLYKSTETMQWWAGNGKKVLDQLQDLLPSKIEEMLSAFWAIDLNNYLNKNEKPVVIFIDTYEALWQNNRLQGSFYEKDEWVREFVLHLPDVFWVIFGREKIQWAKVNEDWGDEKYLEQHLIGELSKNDCNKFLLSCGIEDEKIRNNIIKASKGLPYYLDLMVDTYHLIVEKRNPVPKDFTKTPQKILDRFLEYLDINEKETLRILSFARYWEIELFQHLIKRFETGYPPTAYKELFRFSFITAKETDCWEMHTIMKSSLYEEIKNTDSYLYNQIHNNLFNYYNNKLQNIEVHSIKRENKEHLKEAFYHGKIVLHENEFLIWFLTNGKIMKAAGQLQLINSFYEDLIALISNEIDQKLKGSIYQIFGEIQMLQGNYEQAVNSYSESLDIFNNLIQHDNNSFIKEVCKISMDLAEIKSHTTKYEDAYYYLNEAIKYYEQYSGKSDFELLLDIGLLYIRLGKLNIRFSHYEESRKNYETAIKICKDSITQFGENGKVFAMIALAYEKLGELVAETEYGDQGQYYRSSIEYYEKALQHKESIEYTRILANKGLAHKRLAEYYNVSTYPIEKLNSFKEAIKIYDQVLEQSPDFVDALEKKGHALVDCMNVEIELELLNDAKESFKIAVETFEKVISLAPKQGGSRNRLASVHRDISKLYMKQSNANEAIKKLQESLLYSEETLNETPNYIYLHNSMGKSYELLGDVYTAIQKKNEAEKNYEQAIKQYNKMLSKAPNLRESLKRKEITLEKINNLKNN